jgi:hypothetical protein
MRCQELLRRISKYPSDLKKHTSNSKKKLICPKSKGTSFDRVKAKANLTGGRLETVASNRRARASNEARLPVS